MLTNGIQVQKYVRASAGRAGIAIQFEETNMPRHDGRTIYLPRITQKTTEEELQQLMASVDHEVAHDRFSSFKVVKESGIDANGILMFLWNFLEDSRVNSIEAKEYRGFRENWDICNSKLITRICLKAKKETSFMSKFIVSLICWESGLSASSFPQIELACSMFSPDEEITNVIDPFISDLAACHLILDKEIGTKATYDLAVKILTALGKDKEVTRKLLVPVSGKDKKGKASKESEESTEETGEGAEGIVGIEEEDKKTESEKEVKEDEYKIIKVKLTKEELEKFSLSMPEDGRDVGKVGVNFDPVAMDTGSWDLTDYSHFIVVNYPKRTGDDIYLTSVERYRNDFLHEYEKTTKSQLITQENFAQQIRRLIQIRAKVQTQYGVKKGKLDQSRLSRICFNAPGFNEKVFKHKIENKTLDAAITVLVDLSGSMSGTKLHFAIASALLVNEVCSVVNIPLEVLGFTDGYSSALHESAPLMFIYKGFSDLRVSHDDMITSFISSSRHMAGNPDGENIVWAHDRLVSRQEKRKLLIVMSDGSPAASKSSWGLEKFTKTVIEEIEARKQVSIYGLGLCSSSVEHYYKANSVVREPQEIPSKLLHLIEKGIINV